MNPVPLMLLVEGIRGLQTSDETFKSVRALAEKMGKTFIEGRDMPGFVVNRILVPMINEAFFALYEGLADAKSIEHMLRAMLPDWHFSRTFYEDLSVGELGWKVMISRKPEQSQDTALGNAHQCDESATCSNWLTRAIATVLRIFTKR